jgi:hypothetical protein
MGREDDGSTDPGGKHGGGDDNKDDGKQPESK